MDDQQLERYSRHILLPEIDIAGQTRLLQSKVLIIGVGGLGSPAAIYLATSGIGQITLCDDDDVDLSNLQRQIAHSSARIGDNKATSAQAALQALNPEVTVTTLKQRLKGDALLEAVSQADVVLDASDNFTTRGNSPCYRCLYDESAIADEENCAQSGIFAPLTGIIGSMMAAETLKLLIPFGKPLDTRLLLLDATIMEWRSLQRQKDPTCPICA